MTRFPGLPGAPFSGDPPVITTSDFKRNLVIEFEGQPWQIVDYTVSTPSARGSAAIVKTRLKNLIDGTVVDKPFRSGDRFKEPDYERRATQYLYSDDRFAHFMDNENFEQMQIALDDLGDSALYLHDGMPDVTVMVWNGGPINIQLPAHVELEITETEPSVKGATATAQTKAATLSTGLVVQVPAYIKQGETVRVDTRTGEFLQRVNK